MFWRDQFVDLFYLCNESVERLQLRLQLPQHLQVIENTWVNWHIGSIWVSLLQEERTEIKDERKVKLQDISSV